MEWVKHSWNLAKHRSPPILAGSARTAIIRQWWLRRSWRDQQAQKGEFVHRSTIYQIQPLWMSDKTVKLLKVKLFHFCNLIDAMYLTDHFLKTIILIIICYIQMNLYIAKSFFFLWKTQFLKKNLYGLSPWTYYPPCHTSWMTTSHFEVLFSSRDKKASESWWKGK